MEFFGASIDYLQFRTWSLGLCEPLLCWCPLGRVCWSPPILRRSALSAQAGYEVVVFLFMRKVLNEPTCPAGLQELSSKTSCHGLRWPEPPLAVSLHLKCSKLLAAELFFLQLIIATIIFTLLYSLDGLEGEFVLILWWNQKAAWLFVLHMVLFPFIPLNNCCVISLPTELGNWLSGIFIALH